MRLMRILIVAMSESIHTARWISQISDQGWDLFPSIDNGLINPDIKKVTVHHSIYGALPDINSSVNRRGLNTFNRSLAYLGRTFMQRQWPQYRAHQLCHTINKIKPDIIHSLEIQHAGYLTLDAKNIMKNTFPTWIVTNWGSDIYLFGRLAAHQDRIKQVLSMCDYYSCECLRDADLAQEFGFTGTTLPIFPNAGGFNIEKTSKLRSAGKTSSRRLIMLKGYQTWAGRALIGLRALERCSDILDGYKIAIYSTSPEVVIAAELFSQSTGIPTVIIPKDTSHEEILRLHGQARISLGLSISDAVSTSLLEAIVMGSFPIQSWTAATEEWIIDGETGILVPPEDPDVIEKAIRTALSNDTLVDSAADENYTITKNRLDYSIIKKKTIQFYEQVYNENR